MKPLDKRKCKVNMDISDKLWSVSFAEESFSFDYSLVGNILGYFENELLKLGNRNSSVVKWIDCSRYDAFGKLNVSHAFSASNYDRQYPSDTISLIVKNSPVSIHAFIERYFNSKKPVLICYQNVDASFNVDIRLLGIQCIAVCDNIDAINCVNPPTSSDGYYLQKLLSSIRSVLDEEGFIYSYAIYYPMISFSPNERPFSFVLA